MNTEDLAAQDRAFAEQTAPVSADAIWRTVEAMDRTGNGHFGPLFGHVRDSVVHFVSEYGAAGTPSALDRALAQLCQPLLVYARLLDGMHAKLTHPDADVRINLPSLHADGKTVSTRFVQALKLADPEGHRSYIGFLTDSISEAAFDAELARTVTDRDRRRLFIAAASALKDGARAVHMAMSAGARDVSELKAPEPEGTP